MRSKTVIEEIDRGVYDIKNNDEFSFKTDKGLTHEIVDIISTEKNDPQWMREFRHKSLDIYNEIKMVSWGPSIEDLDMDNIVAYVRPKSDIKGTWEELPEEIKDTFDRLGIPEAEKQSLAGVGAQYDSEVVYHSIQEELVKQGVIYTDMETALREYGDIVKEYFMKCVPANAHKFAALHGAVWS